MLAFVRFRHLPSIIHFLKFFRKNRKNFQKFGKLQLTCLYIFLMIKHQYDLIIKLGQERG